MSEKIELSAPATQSGFARLVGVSQQAISKQVEKGVLIPGQSLSDWLVSYCHHLRTEAAGRAKENEKSFAEQRLKESEQSTLRLAISNCKELEVLVLAEEIAPTIFQAFDDTTTELNNAAIRIQERLESELSIQVNDEIIFGPIRTAAGSIAKVTRELGKNLIEGVGSFDLEEAETDS